MDKALKIDRKSYLPAYAQIVDIIRKQISSGEYPPGSRLPSESQLCRQFQVSSVTVRRAISVLVEQGVVDTTQGKGSFIKPLELGSFSFDLRELQEVFEDEEDTQVKLLKARIIKADAALADKLPVEEGDRAIHICRLISSHGTPLIYNHQYLIYDPSRPIVESELDLTSLGGLFAGTGKTNLKRGDLRLKPASLSEDEARYLQEKPGTPAFCLEHTFFDLQDKQISWGWFIFLNERLHFGAKVGV